MKHINWGYTLVTVTVWVTCVVLEIKGVGADSLWVLAVLLCIFGDFDRECEKCENHQR
jgi:hypothetical protein